MKIAFIGTHGSGKTTLAHELVVKLKKEDINAEFLGEIARLCPLPINQETTQEAQEWIIYNQYTKELENEHILKNPKGYCLVCDRSVLDSYVYYCAKFGEKKLLEDFVIEKIKNYDFLFRVPKNPNYLKADGKRAVEVGFQEKIDRGFDYILDKLSIQYYTTSNIEEILGIIKNDRSI